MALEGKIHEEKIVRASYDWSGKEKPTDMITVFNYLKECHVEGRTCSETRQEAIGLNYKEGDFKWILEKKFKMLRAVP